MATYSWLNRALAGSSQRPAHSAYGSYDSNNLDSQNMRGASELAASRVRNSGYFPYAASQMAAADGVGGALPYSTPAARAPVAPRPLSPTEAYQKAADEAKAATLARREQVLSGYDTSLDEADSLIGGALGMTDAERNARRGNMLNMAALRERGLGSSTEMSYAGETYRRALKDINLDQAMRVAGFRSGLQGQKLRTLENITDAPPDTRPYDAAMRELGAGSTEGMQYPSGPPAIHGNPYGMPMGGGQQQQPSGEQASESSSGDSKQGGSAQGQPYDPRVAAQWVKGMNRQLSYQKARDAKAAAEEARLARRRVPTVTPPSVVSYQPMPARPMPMAPAPKPMTYAVPQSSPSALAAIGGKLKKHFLWQ